MNKQVDLYMFYSNKSFCSWTRIFNTSYENAYWDSFGKAVTEIHGKHCDRDAWEALWQMHGKAVTKFSIIIFKSLKWLDIFFVYIFWKVEIGIVNLITALSNDYIEQIFDFSILRYIKHDFGSFCPHVEPFKDITVFFPRLIVWP